MDRPGAGGADYRRAPNRAEARACCLALPLKACLKSCSKPASRGRPLREQHAERNPRVLCTRGQVSREDAVDKAPYFNESGIGILDAIALPHKAGTVPENTGIIQAFE